MQALASIAAAPVRCTRSAAAASNPPLARPAVRAPESAQRRHSTLLVCHAEGEDKPSPVVSEDVLARLKQAEQEAAALREELAAAQAAKAESDGAEVPEEPAVAEAKARIDGANLRRETLGSVNSDSRNWLQETDVEFFTGNGAVESGGGELTEEEKATVTRRLIGGGLATAGLAAFGLIPTETLRGKPSKPLFFYLTTVLRTEEALGEIDGPLAEGDLERVSQIVRRIKDTSGTREAMYAACAWINVDDGKKAKAAEVYTQEFLEYLTGVDYKNFYDTARSAAALSGKEKVAFVQYGENSLRVARTKLDSFFSLVPAEQLEAARTQIKPMF